MRKVSVHVGEDMRAGIAAGRVRSFARLVQALTSAGWHIDWRAPDAEPLPFHITDTAPPMGPQGLVLRRAYAEPFFRLERSVHRWDWDVAHLPFPRRGHGPHLGQGLAATLRRKLLGQGPVTREGFIFVPLQGRLLDTRSFQSASPLAMLEILLAHDPRPIRATLHPKEDYSPAELTALDDLARRSPRLTLGGASQDLARTCDLIATQNSALAFAGYAAHKPALLFARCDFHHIAASVPRDGLAPALAALNGPEPPFDAYLHWFLRRHAIDVSAEDAAERFAARLATLGWPMN